MGSNQYVAKGGEATRPQMIKERLEEIKAVVEYNESLKGEYNFRVTVDKMQVIHTDIHVRVNGLNILL